MNLNFNFLNILIFAGTIQGFIFGIVVLTSKAFGDKTNKYLALTIISLSINNLYYWFIDIGLEKYFPETSLFYIPWNLFFPITFYIYVLGYIKEQVTKYIFLILFIPFSISSIIHITNNILYYFSNKHLVWIEFFYISEEYVAFIGALLIGFMSFKKLKEAKKKDSKLNIKWLNILLRAGLILCLVWVIIYSLAIKFNLGGLKLYYPIWLGISAMFYWVGYRGLYQFRLAKDRRAISLLLNEISKMKNDGLKNPQITNEYTEEHPIFKKLLELIEKKHIYREQNLTLYSLAIHLKTNTSTLSKVINQIANKGFIDFINDYRIAEAKEILNNPLFDLYKISAIGYEVGFNNASTFHSTFKKYTGSTPAKYRKLVM